ncbi:hypothetical protein L1987_05909 [Smallanthus sonchifolius]|uniref:Uncharacterized protein n=1 Tax=Smallanthus sonchifolius TaxID=185202 RepID=A0ACB9JX21_9ASTR|nr:hypothetical protein L1987_05909 [Smallanthus sonchifolius]
MAMRGRGGRGNPSRPPRLITGRVYEQFKPMSEWRQEDDYDTLLLYLPGFQKEYIKVTTEDLNIVRVRGERLIADNKWSRFQEDYRVPENCEMRGIKAKFDGGILTVTMPRKITNAPPRPPPTTTQLPPIKKEQPFRGAKQEEALPNPKQEPKEKKPEKPQTTPLDGLIPLPPPPRPPPTTTQLPPNKKEQPFRGAKQEEALPNPKQEPKEKKPKKPQTTPLEGLIPLPPPPPPPSTTTDTQLLPRTKQEPTPKEETKEKKPEKPQSSPLDLPPQPKATSLSTPTKQEPLKPTPEAKGIGSIPNRTLKQDKHSDVEKPSVVEKTDLDKEKGKGKEALLDEGEPKQDLKGTPGVGTSGGFWHSGAKKTVARSWMVNEDRKALVNIGVSVLVIVALGVHVAYTIGLISKGK